MNFSPVTSPCNYCLLIVTLVGLINLGVGLGLQLSISWDVGLVNTIIGGLLILGSISGIGLLNWKKRNMTNRQRVIISSQRTNLLSSLNRNRPIFSPSTTHQLPVVVDQVELESFLPSYQQAVNQPVSHQEDTQQPVIASSSQVEQLQARVTQLEEQLTALTNQSKIEVLTS